MFALLCEEVGSRGASSQPFDFGIETDVGVVRALLIAPPQGPLLSPFKKQLFTDRNPDLHTGSEMRRVR